MAALSPTREHSMTPSGIHPILYAFFDSAGGLDRAAMRAQVQACVVGRAARLQSVAPVAPPNRSANGMPRCGRPPKWAQAKASPTINQQFALAVQKAGGESRGAR